MNPVTACVLCGGTRWITREEARPFRVVECRCGLIFVAPQPDAATLARAYDGDYYREWRPQQHQRARLWRARLATVAALAGPPATLLDVGCATGEFLDVARAAGWKTAGTEVSAYAAAEAEGGGHQVVHGELWESGFPDAGVDVITCWHVLEHVREPARVLGEMQRILRSGGWLVLAVPNTDDRVFRTVYRVVRRRPPRLFHPEDRELHLFHFTARTLRALVESAGLQVVSVGFDRGAAVVGGKKLVNDIAYVWYRLSGLNWGMGLELVARRP